MTKLLHGEWAAMLAREGVQPLCAIPTGSDNEHPPCPACGTAAPLVDGACSDCGLQLEDVMPKGGPCGSDGCTR